MDDQSIISEKLTALKRIFEECMKKLGIIEGKQNKVIDGLREKTEEKKIDRIKKEIEVL